jgi:hypothetical protein
MNAAGVERISLNMLRTKLAEGIGGPAPPPWSENGHRIHRPPKRVIPFRKEPLTAPRFCYR